ncbi:hypothetical protein ACFO26_03400 [Lactococcus nasutitermitis]|uniref:Transposase n=1 Tax=Lactococcus nasutitermitis TaxID=1652957 RepID=A0ABV9JAX1_9LACT|nr:hypothetical protein [Lactococcus nasutitermitis]
MNLVKIKKIGKSSLVSWFDIFETKQKHRHRFCEKEGRINALIEKV